MADRNGSLETNESSSPETNQSDQVAEKQTKTPPPNTLFDFNEFFKIDNIPGLTVSTCYFSLSSVYHTKQQHFGKHLTNEL